MLTRGGATAITAQPVVWSALGYPFEAAAMLAGVAACLTVRLWVSLNDRPMRPLGVAIDLTVTMLALLFTAGWVVLERPSPFYALLGGAGFGALGAGIIAASVAWIRRMPPLAKGDAVSIAPPGHVRKEP